MSSLADLPDVVGFFSYSREDDNDSLGALSALRSRIQGELRAQLGRTGKTFRLWQDKEAIPFGAMWETEIKNAAAQSAFFIPIITPTVVASPYCRFELEAFLAREAELGRSDLVFPVLYIDVPALEDSARRQNDPVLALIAKRQYVDWRKLRHRAIHTTDVSEAVEQFCRHIRDALNKPCLSPEERVAQEKAAALQRAEDERKRQEAENQRQEEEARKRAAAVRERERADEEQRQREEDAEQRRAEERRRRDEAKAKRLAAEEQRRAENEERRRRRGQQARPLWPPSRPALVTGSVVCLVLFGAIGAWVAGSRGPASPAGPMPVPAGPAPAPAPVAAAPAPVAPAPPASANPAPAPIAPSPAHVAPPTPLEEGARVAKRCEICHSLDKGGPNKVGPALYGVVFRPVASVPGFNYSAALKARGGVWTPVELLHYLTPATADVPGSNAARHSVPDTQQRDFLIAFLSTLQ
jgi:cytochrome c2